MIGDEENTEFISEVSKQEKNESKLGPLKSDKKTHVNNLIYFGATLAFTCIIMLLFWNVKKQSFHKKNAHLLVISQEEFDYFDQLSDTTKVSNCNQTISNQNTLVIVSNQIVKDDVKDCIEHLKPQFSDILLIIYNATQESILKEEDKNVIQYYLSNTELSIPNSEIQKFEQLEEDEQLEVVAQIINNIFK
ncbi:unnamed protein product (macronuclear) [Paramecium tetraurelia]|uniref:Peroxisome assembly protein 22 n=1 Tax=Paramecium tetraurelia TaxID=5888 RepID=A0D0S3_PARTE|nr:uncharacterized protein GSPATT00012192001 [Paramecium tetraurelia]CAK76640.1 unnamed protein product [Paramecium tetraurelia]|eukprot:XP_001444037.1 hypothetical protein (macronuclear) [Paramecium tetraurelia strain d4-2]